MIYKCDICKDVGFIVKTEWVDTDTSYDVKIICVCREE